MVIQHWSDHIYRHIRILVYNTTMMLLYYFQYLVLVFALVAEVAPKRSKHIGIVSTYIHTLSFWLNNQGLVC